MILDLAGIVGVDYRPLTFRSLLRMADARRHEQWLMAAWQVSWIRGALTGERLVPDDITPFRRRIQPKSPLHIAAESRQGWAAVNAFFGLND
ncbi:hypothetical protein [Zavarzinella formosa]|uniref:hypothetical protein n=1 Tax=Zavarzinella formosa TaxID=360055 RepID=UPI00031F6AE3|nr:hypothetical protein [Zavarzinella formosa]